MRVELTEKDPCYQIVHLEINIIILCVIANERLFNSRLYYSCIENCVDFVSYLKKKKKHKETISIISCIV